MNEHSLRLTLANRLDALEPARQAVAQFLAPAGLSAQALFKLELVLEETFMNLLWHAFQDGGDHLIELAVQWRPDAVVLDFVDDGVAFDPTQAIDPPLPASLLDAPVGGRGLMLLRRNTRSLSYERREGRNHLQLVVATA